MQDHESFVDVITSLCFRMKRDGCGMVSFVMVGEGNVLICEKGFVRRFVYCFVSCYDNRHEMDFPWVL